MPLSIPIATYRIQFNKNFTFRDAVSIIPYLHQLGISHCYASPITQAKEGSQHGYDVVNYNAINSEIGSLDDFKDFVQVLHHYQMGLILDIVPNHMGITGHKNAWWQDVLEHGIKSRYAGYFDIDWHYKIYLPILDQPFGMALEGQLLQIFYEKEKFYLKFRDNILPTNRESRNFILQSFFKEVKKLISEKDSIWLLLEEGKLEPVFKKHPFLLKLLLKQLEVMNGIKGSPSSFDSLENFLNMQHYRLCYWKLASSEINYRRFFDIFEYASIRIEKPEVFQEVHELIFKFLRDGFINGLRIDHIDGLWDPRQYLENLRQATCENLSYLIVEKILLGNEQLESDWPVQGTVGYDFLNQVNGLFIEQNQKEALLKVYQTFTNSMQNSVDIKYACKKLILETSLVSELKALTQRLKQIAEKHRHFRDFTLENLKSALTEVIACFPVYRTYIRSHPPDVHPNDRKVIVAAISKAKHFNRTIDFSVYKFIEDILFLNYPEGSDQGLQKQCRDFVMRFQQVTGAVMAKGIEDTAFYRYFPLASLNEVGGEMGIFGINLENFHKKNRERFATFSDSLLATTTHDTKRSEDVRARLNVLSELPDEWENTIFEWAKINQKHKFEKDEKTIPDRNDEYLLYQTLVGTWPLEGLSEIYFLRIQMYMEKAIKEAKVHSSWIDPNEEYIHGMKIFIQKILKDPLFLESFSIFFSKIKEMGMLNSISQVILKMTSPGVPDFYQGHEIWNFSLVDPDNRQTVDYAKLQALLNEVKDSPKLHLEEPSDGKIKLFVIQKILQLRQFLTDVFRKGCYLPLNIQGSAKEEIVAFSRIFEDKAVIVIVGRFFTFYRQNFQSELSTHHWKGMGLEVPQELSEKSFINIFTGEVVKAEEGFLPLESVLCTMPWAVLQCCYKERA